MAHPIPTHDGPQAAEPVLTPVRALVEAASTPLAVFDDLGACLAANRAYRDRAAGGAERRAPFSPDGVRTWSLAMLPEEPSSAAREQAELGHRAKSRFLAAMSHELRTPLNAVIGFAELMQEEALGPLGHADYKEYAGLILRSGVNLLDMVSNLLDFTRAEAGSLELSVAPVEMVRLVRGVLTRARDQVASAAVPGRVTILEDLPASTLAIRADEQRLRQVLRSLIDNAVKFTPDGGHVTVGTRALDDGGAEVVVADSGIGMTQEELAHVFEPFWQADSSLGRARAGAGMGLKLARQLVALHGGTLAMESARGAGTRVILRLPPAPTAARSAV